MIRSPRARLQGIQFPPWAVAAGAPSCRLPRARRPWRRKRQAPATEEGEHAGGKQGREGRRWPPWLGRQPAVTTPPAKLGRSRKPRWLTGREEEGVGEGRGRRGGGEGSSRRVRGNGLLRRRRTWGEEGVGEVGAFGEIRSLSGGAGRRWGWRRRQGLGFGGQSPRRLCSIGTSHIDESRTIH